MVRCKFTLFQKNRANQEDRKHEDLKDCNIKSLSRVGNDLSIVTDCIPKVAHDAWMPARCHHIWQHHSSIKGKNHTKPASDRTPSRASLPPTGFGKFSFFTSFRKVFTWENMPLWESGGRSPHNIPRGQGLLIARCSFKKVFFRP